MAGPGNWNTVCSVNPEWGLEHKVERLVQEPIRTKKIAVIGGGPVGMEAALLSAKRSHNVTLYEKEDHLGGLLCAMDGVELKWTITRFKHYMIRQIEKSAVKVCLSTVATPEMIRAENYDEVIVAIGSEPLYLPIPGLDGDNVVPAIRTVEEEPNMGEHVVVIGGGEIGVEMGIYLAQKGHQVELIEIGDTLSPESVPVHFRSIFEQTWENQEGFTYHLKARCTGVDPDGVRYMDAEGNEQKLYADKVVLAAGMKAKQDEAMTFLDGTVRTHMIGDCLKVGCIQTGLRAAYALANNI